MGPKKVSALRAYECASIFAVSLRIFALFGSLARRYGRAVVVLMAFFGAGMFKRIFFAVLTMFALGLNVSSVAFASDEGKACKADADCEHGEHCKEGHCHK